MKKNQPLKKRKVIAVRPRTKAIISRSDGRKVKAKIDAKGDTVASSGCVDGREDVQICEKIRSALVAGNTYEAACRLGGVSLSTFMRWMKQGRESKEGTMARDFYESMEFASAQAEHRNVMCIQNAAGKGNWQAAAWWLERRRPQNFARRDVVSLGNEGGTPFEVNVTEGSLTDVEKQAALAAVLRRNPSLIPKGVKR
jgi:hypothetical protein